VVSDVGRGVGGMSVILLVLGILLAAAGGALIGFGFPIRELSLGTTLILAGAFAFVGGLILVGLSAVVTELARLGAALKGALPQVQTAQAAVARAARIEVPAPPAESVAREPVKEVVNEGEPQVAAAPAPAAAAAAAAAPAVEVSASAIERLRSTIPRADKAVPEAEEAVPLSPNGQHAAHHVEAPTQVEPVPRSAGAAAVETREPRLDFLFRPRQTRPAPQQEAFDSLWPKRPAQGQPDPRLEVARAPAVQPAPHPHAAPAAAPAPAPAPAPQERTVAILKSGVVDGMAYTLYADGSIEAQLPQGTVRFGSIAELRAHIENNA
jgi:hypothetical protein